MDDVNFTCPDAIELHTPTDSNDQKWLKLRHTGVGASEAPILMGEGYAGSSPETVWEHKMSDVEPTFDDDTLRLFARGHMLEPVAVKVFLEENPELVAIDGALFRSKINPYMLATPDRLVSDGGGLEIKTAHNFQFKRYSPDVVPPRYYWQAVQCMFVTGRTHWYIFVLHPDSFNTMTWRIDASDPQVAADMNLLNLTILDFWESYVLTGIRPTDMVMAGLSEPEIDPDGVAIPEEEEDTIVGLLDRRAELDEEIKGLTAERGAIDDALKSIVGDQEQAHVGGKVLWTFKSSSRTGIDAKGLKAMKEEHPDVYDKYVKVTSSRRLSIK